MENQHEKDSDLAAGSLSMSRHRTDGSASSDDLVSYDPDYMFAPPGWKETQYYESPSSQRSSNSSYAGLYSPFLVAPLSNTQNSYGDPGSTSNAFDDNSIFSLYSPRTNDADVHPTPSSLGWARNTELLELYQFVVPRSKEPYLELLNKYTPNYETPSKIYLDDKPRYSYYTP